MTVIDQGSVESEETTICRTIEGAWDEALSEQGVERAVMLLVMTFITVPFAPFWMVLIPIERAGYFSYEEGFHL